MPLMTRATVFFATRQTTGGVANVPALCPLTLAAFAGGFIMASEAQWLNTGPTVFPNRIIISMGNGAPATVISDFYGTIGTAGMKDMLDLKGPGSSSPFGGIAIVAPATQLFVTAVHSITVDVNFGLTIWLP